MEIGMGGVDDAVMIRAQDEQVRDVVVERGHERIDVMNLVDRHRILLGDLLSANLAAMTVDPLEVVAKPRLEAKQHPDRQSEALSQQTAINILRANEPIYGLCRHFMPFVSRS